MALVKYIPHLETVEVKTALEIAEEEYRRAADEAAKWNKISYLISDKCGEYNDELEAINKAFRNLAGRYKRSTKADTRARLYYQMLILRRQIESIEPIVDALQKMYDEASAQYHREYSNELAAKRNVVIERAAAGFKFGVHVNLELGGKKIPLESNVKTIAAAVNFICQNADGLVNWLIYTESVNGLTTRRNIITESKSIDREIFFALIQKYGDSTIVIDAEIAAPQKATAPHFDTPAGEFKAIAFRAMHYFTLGDFLTPIAELRAFCRKNKLPYAERELAEWIQIATDNGVEVPAEFIEVPAAEIVGDDVVAKAAEFGISVITSKPNRRGALICYVNGEKISYQRADEMYRNHFGDGKVIWCYGLNEAEAAERVSQALSDTQFAVETFSLAPLNLPNAEEFTGAQIIRDTQFAICSITNWLPAIKRHEKIIGEQKARCVALQAGTIKAADLNIQQVLNHSAASLRQNISKLKAGIAVLTAAGYLQRAQKRLDFL